MANPRILAIDQGTTSTRAVMFDAAGKPLASSQVPLRQIYPADGWVEHDPEEIWLSTLAVCRAVITETGGVEGVAALGITNQRETTVVWNRKTGRPVMNAIVWQDRRGSLYGLARGRPRQCHTEQDRAFDRFIFLGNQGPMDS